MTWVPVGYTAKRRMRRATWASPWPDYPDAKFPGSSPVEEICSVSNCISSRPLGIEDAFRENPLELFHTAALACDVVPLERRADFALYAYQLWPMQFDDGQEEAIHLWWEPTVEPMPSTFVRLGWDAVAGGNGHSFGCSPLSCNSGADMVKCEHINQYCLVNDEHAAIALARRFSITKPEPGPYCVVEVWRDASTIAEQSV